MPTYNEENDLPEYDAIANAPVGECDCCTPCDCPATRGSPWFKGCTPATFSLAFDFAPGCYFLANPPQPDTSTLEDTPGTLCVGPGGGGGIIGNPGAQIELPSLWDKTITGGSKVHSGSTCAGSVLNSSDIMAEVFIGKIPAGLGFQYGLPDGTPIFRVTYGTTFLGFQKLEDIEGDPLLPGLTAANFPLTIDNTLTDGGSVDVSIECCGDATGCPTPSLASQCCGMLILTLPDSCMVSTWVLYASFVFIGTDISTDDGTPEWFNANYRFDGWASLNEEARIWCEDGKWNLKVIDICQTCGMDADDYVLFQTSGASICPPLKAANWTLITSTFGDTPTVNLSQAYQCAAPYPPDCHECCKTYAVTPSLTGCAAMNGVSVTLQTSVGGDNVVPCQWTDGTNFIRPNVDGYYYLRIYDATCTNLSGTTGGYVEWRATTLGLGGNACPPTDVATWWTCVHDDFRDLAAVSVDNPAPTFVVATSDCECASADCCDPIYLTVDGSTNLDGDFVLTETGDDEWTCEPTTENFETTGKISREEGGWQTLLKRGAFFLRMVAPNSKCPPSTGWVFDNKDEEDTTSPTTFTVSCSPPVGLTCATCCTSYQISLGGTGCVDTITTPYTYVQTAGTCLWTFSDGSTISKDEVNGVWRLRFTDGSLACGGTGSDYVEWTATLDGNICPPFLLIAWTKVHDDFGTTILASINRDGCEGDDSVCPENCDACCDTCTINMDDNNGTPVDVVFVLGETCDWRADDSGPLSEAEISCTAAFWTIHTLWAGVTEIAFTAPVDDSGCPPTDPSAWTAVVGDSVIHSITTSGCA